MIDGILNVDKPAGWTSHDVVGFLRGRLGVKKMGHAGTLDPFATGVLVVCMGQATRIAEYLTASVKSYRAVAELGLTTDTYDIDGAVQTRAPIPPLSEDDLRRTLAAFEGEIEQYPPAYSAIKQDGVPAYRRARRGEQVELPARTVYIHEARLLAWNAPHLEFEVTCEAGTYIRSIAHDLGQELGCGAILVALTRTRSGPFRVEDALRPDALAEAAAAGTLAAYVHPLREALYDLTPVQINAEEATRLTQGQAIGATQAPAQPIGYALDADAQVRAILRYDADEQLWRPAKVFNTQE